MSPATATYRNTSVILLSDCIDPLISFIVLLWTHIWSPEQNLGQELKIPPPLSPRHTLIPFQRLIHIFDCGTMETTINIRVPINKLVQAGQSQTVHDIKKKSHILFYVSKNFICLAARSFSVVSLSFYSLFNFCSLEVSEKFQCSSVIIL